MSTEDISALVSQLDVTSSRKEEEVWALLREHGVGLMPYFRAAYPRFKKWPGRASLVYHAIRYGRSNEDAFQLGLAALQDKAQVVRYRACMLLAYALRDAALPALAACANHADPRTAEDARAAIDAIRNRNHHYFVDRDHSGMMRWVVCPEDER